MPYKKTYSKKSKKTFAKKPFKKTYAKSSAVVPSLPRNFVKSGLGFPAKMLMKHKYFDSFDIGNTGGSTATINFRANGMYDPNQTLTGHQPYYFDQMCAVYNHYTVIASRIWVNISHMSATNTSANACVWINDDTTVTPTLGNLMEQSKAKFINLPYGNLDPRKLTMGWSAKKTFGGSILANTTLQGSATADPTEQSHFQISIFPQNLSATQSYNCQVIIEYVAIWTELKDISGS